MGYRHRAHFDSSSEMALGERAAGARLQIALKRHRTALVTELHDDINDPWSARGRVWALSGIVCVETGAPIAGYAGVVTGSIRDATEHVHRAFRICHGSHTCNADSNGVPSDFLNLESSRSIDGDSCLPRDGKSGKFCRGAHLRATRYGGHPSRVRLLKLAMYGVPSPGSRAKVGLPSEARSAKLASEGWWPRFSPDGTHWPAGCAKSRTSREPREAVC